MTHMASPEVMRILAHRAPFLFVAELLELVPGERAAAVSHLPALDLQALGAGQDTVPLWYVAEFLAQTGALAVLAGAPPEEKTLMTGLDGFTMTSPATSAEPLRAEVALLGEKRGIGKRQGTVWQGDRKIAEGLIWYARTRA
jgi:3-hydroxyacyl-[acyl-carrier-protein] dehydratase